ncbi:hypothetical protein KC980_04115 [candidate division WWE3 bacterium]|uniref:Uncharacterized protein n=1 Tax=candidate division WWE3 bacterium TaxID=2053526 RepID=A0A955J2R3_UNCKA|nr:hypothetical protein [candidate division WWE3 bacterium]
MAAELAIDLVLPTYDPNEYKFKLKGKDVYVIPAYHPAAHVSESAKISQWEYIWEILD